MILGNKGVKYGLEVKRPPNTTSSKLEASKRPSIFGDSDSEGEQDNVERQIARQAARKQNDKAVAEIHAAALAEDPSVFDYDAHYDAIQESRAAPRRQDKIARQSRYVVGLLGKAEERRREQEVLYERRLKKEREAEDAVFGEKERFVTSAYRKKLEEDAKWREQRAQQEAEEEANAVEKRGHMGDFYRNLFRSNVGFGGKEGAATTATSQTDVQVLDGQKAAASGDRGNEAGAPSAAPSRMPAHEAGQVPAGRRYHGADEDDLMPERRRDKEQKKNREEERKTQRGGGQPAAEARVECRDGGLPGERPAVAAPRGLAADAAGQDARSARNEAVAAARERYLARKRKAGGPPGGSG